MKRNHAIAFAIYILTTHSLCILAYPQSTAREVPTSQSPNVQDKKIQAPPSPALAEAIRLSHQVVKLYEEGKYQEALPLAQRAVTRIELTLGPDDLDVANSIINLASLYLATGDYARAEPLFQRALTTREKLLGPKHPDVAISLAYVGDLYRLKGDYKSAEPPLRRALSIFEEVLGPEHPYVAQALNSIGLLLMDKGEFLHAEKFFNRTLAIGEKLFGPDHPLVAAWLNNLALVSYEKQDYAQAQTLFERVLAIREKAFGPQHPEVAKSLNNLAELHRMKGEYSLAEPLYQRAILIEEKKFGPDDTEVVITLNNLAMLYFNQGDYAKAEPLFLRAFAVRVKALGDDHPEVAISIYNLASLYQAKGDLAYAHGLHQAALNIREKVLGPEHPKVGQSLSSLGVMYIAKGEYERAEPLLQRSLAIYEKAFGINSVNTAAPLNNLALLYFNKGDYKQAELFGLRALAIYEKGFGPERLEVAAALSLLGSLYAAKGEYNRGETFLQRSLSIHQKVFGPDHPRVALSLANLSALYLSKGDIQQAVLFLTHALETRERNLWLITFSGSDREKRAYLETLFPEIYAAVSLHVLTAQSNALASQLAFTTILRYKGRSLDATSFAIESLRHSLDQQDYTLLEQLAVAQSQLANLVFSGPKNMPSKEYATAAMHLEVRVERLQDAISRRSAEFRVLVEPVTLEQVRHVVPEDGALVEFFSYRPYNITWKTLGDRFGFPRYVAYILRHKDTSPMWVELGEATNIDALVEQLRPALRDPRRKDFKRLARTLDERLMRPIRKLLGPTRHIFLAPDGALNLIPFASLVDENGQYLIEKYSINYLTSGRDLLRLQVKGESRETPRVFADPLYDLSPSDQSRLQNSQPASSSVAPNTNHQHSKDFSDLNYRPLRGTSAEAAALNKLFPDATLFMQAAATEAALKKVNRPQFLHIATHGFFLADQTEPTSQAQGAGSELGIDTEPLAAVNRENPLLRSGLILAGVKQKASGPGEDGVLTALEVVGLNLWGTKLAVLSACETGLGDVKDGEGVYGLRRALVLACSESQVMSLWKVSDAGTRDLMVAYYNRLQKGEGRTAAMRQVQLQMLRGQLLPSANSGKRETSDTGGTFAMKDYRHPYYWAAFIQSGDWRSMDGKEASAR